MARSSLPKLPCLTSIPVAPSVTDYFNSTIPVMTFEGLKQPDHNNKLQDIANESYCEEYSSQEFLEPIENFATKSSKRKKLQLKTFKAYTQAGFLNAANLGLLED